MNGWLQLNKGQNGLPRVHGDKQWRRRSSRLEPRAKKRIPSSALPFGVANRHLTDHIIPFSSWASWHLGVARSATSLHLDIRHATHQMSARIVLNASKLHHDHHITNEDLFKTFCSHGPEHTPYSIFGTHWVSESVIKDGNF